MPSVRKRVHLRNGRPMIRADVSIERLPDGAV
jgi:hypothetical protein